MARGAKRLRVLAAVCVMPPKVTNVATADCSISMLCCALWTARAAFWEWPEPGRGHVGDRPHCPRTPEELREAKGVGHGCSRPETEALRD